MNRNVNEAMLRRLSDGDKDAFCAIYNEYWDVIYHFIRKKVGSKQFAEDVAQEIFTALWHRRSEFTDVQNLKHYLAMWSRNYAIKHLKLIAKETQAQRQFTILLDETSQLSVSHEELQFQDKKQRELLQSAIRHLTPRQQEVFQLAKVEGLSYKEVGERLKIAPFSVKKHVYDAMLIIRDRFRLAHGEIAQVVAMLIFMNFFAHKIILAI